jgi:hypothetical protein
MTTIEAVRELALTLPRSYEALVRDRVKFRVGQIVYLAFSRDETQMGFAFPKEEREALVASEPHRFMMPEVFDLRTTGYPLDSRPSTTPRDARDRVRGVADGRSQAGRRRAPDGMTFRSTRLFLDYSSTSSLAPSQRLLLVRPPSGRRLLFL